MQNIAGLIIYTFLGILTSICLLVINKIIKKTIYSHTDKKQITSKLDKYLCHNPKTIVLCLMFVLFLIAAILLFTISSVFSNTETQEIIITTIFCTNLLICLLFCYGKNLLKL